jgi:hypothetical protein
LPGGHTCGVACEGRQPNSHSWEVKKASATDSKVWQARMNAYSHHHCAAIDSICIANESLWIGNLISCELDWKAAAPCS